MHQKRIIAILQRAKYRNPFLLYAGNEWDNCANEWTGTVVCRYPVINLYRISQYASEIEGRMTDDTLDAYLSWSTIIHHVLQNLCQGDLTPNVDPNVHIAPAIPMCTNMIFTPTLSILHNLCYPQYNQYIRYHFEYAHLYFKTSALPVYTNQPLATPPMVSGLVVLIIDYQMVESRQNR